MAMRVIAGAICAVLLATPLLALDRDAAAGSGTTEQRTVQSSIFVEDPREGHELVQSVGLDRLTTKDVIAGVPFDGAEFRTYEQADLRNGTGLVRGYGVWQAASGEALYLVYGYKVPPRLETAPTSPFSGTFEWVGGTGALAGLTGKGTLEGEISGAGRLRYRWAGSYKRPQPLPAE